MEYDFYFDESFHDRKIKLTSSGELNTLSDNALDSYIGVFWGCLHNDLNDAVTLLTAFEEKQKAKFGLSEGQELKSTTIAKKNFKYGVATFNSNTLDFYRDLFQCLLEIKPILQFEIISKIEFAVRNIFRDFVVSPRYQVNEGAFYYSLTKFICNYHTRDLIAALFNVHDSKSIYNLRKQLLRHLSNILSTIKYIPRKKKEYVSFREMYLIFRDSSMNFSLKKEYDFSYSPNFDGLSLLFKEIGISIENVNLTIDNEEKTYSSAKAFPFKTVQQADSKSMVQIRIADFISGFIGRMIYALSKDECRAEDKIEQIEDIGQNDLTNKRLQSNRWFEISQEQFDFYMLLYKTLVENHEYYWSTMTLNYCDDAIGFYSLLHYFSHYNSYEDFLKTDSRMHSE